MLATAKMVDGDTSLSSSRIDFNKLSAVSFNPTETSQNLSVLAVHKTSTYITTGIAIAVICIAISLLYLDFPLT